MAKEYKSYTTEKGKTMWAKVNTQIDTFEQLDGTIKEVGYVINVYFDDATTEKLKKQANQAIVDAKSSGDYVNKKTGKPMAWRENPRVPYAVDDEGKTYFKFKTNHKKKLEDGSLADKYVSLFDASLNQMEKMTAIGNESIVKINYTPEVFYISTEQNGVKFYLNAIQIIDLKTFNGGSDGAAFGFGVEVNNDYFPVDHEEEPFV